ncbi:protein of unknown function [Lentzea fradiae]|uniref:DUF397 domain-containing protein n=1 Tax=Lentzea fradiae TaxID=200378 RepID=A0A1G7UDL0_9PSEU|nr:DUF397 domain-containing protein [Lentzea fradiae]SDG45428.1 protein of unknown function [Lentzea fradiae]
MSHGRSWRKSSHSGPEHDSACVEVSLAAAAPAALVRDSKAVRGDVLTFSARAWRAFVASVA